MSRNEKNEGRRSISEAEKCFYSTIAVGLLALFFTPIFMNTSGNEQVSGQTVQILQPVPEAADWAQNNTGRPTGTPAPDHENHQNPVPVQAPTPAVTPTP